MIGRPSASLPSTHDVPSLVLPSVLPEPSVVFWVGVDEDVVGVGDDAGGWVCVVGWVAAGLDQWEEAGEINGFDEVVLAPAPALLAVDVSSDDEPSDEDSDSLAGIGINEAARRSEVDWVDWEVELSTGFASLMTPMVSTKPVMTAAPPSKNLFLYTGTRSIDNMRTHSL